MVDHLQSRGTPCRLCTSDVKVRGILSKMDVFKSVSQLDLASLRDHKNMLLSELLNGKGVFIPHATGSGKSLFLCKCLP